MNHNERSHFHNIHTYYVGENVLFEMDDNFWLWTHNCPNHMFYLTSSIIENSIGSLVSEVFFICLTTYLHLHICVQSSNILVKKRANLKYL